MADADIPCEHPDATGLPCARVHEDRVGEGGFPVDDTVGAKRPESGETHNQIRAWGYPASHPEMQGVQTPGKKLGCPGGYPAHGTCEADDRSSALQPATSAHDAPEKSFYDGKAVSFYQAHPDRSGL